MRRSTQRFRGRGGLACRVVKRVESEVAEDVYKDSVWKIGFTKVRWIS